jgi:phenylacetate-coenzyme A ligase PaaK-like adenylate-forming protein
MPRFLVRPGVRMSIRANIRRNIVEPAWAGLSGTPLLAAWKELEKTQFLSPSDLRARQSEKLRRLVASVYAASPFYRDRFDRAGVRPKDIQTPDDLARLPLLSKHTVRTEIDRIIAPGLDRSRLQESRTGGSTGVPLVLYFTEEVSERRNAAARRCNRWTGWEAGESVGAVWGNPHLPSTLRERLRAALLDPVIYLDTMQLRPETIAAFADEWRRVQPTLLFGHAHSLYMLARGARDLGLDTIRPKAIISTSMMLLPHERIVIEQVFGVGVFDRYGCEEVGLIGAECERHHGMHINIDHLVVEFVREDGSPASSGELGHLVLTDLLNEAMPLIRYRIEDVATLRSGACPCGRALPLMDSVAGRVADFLRRKDGTQVAGVSLIENSLTKFPGIEQLQIVQNSLDSIHLRIVPDAAFSESVRSRLTDYFAGTFPGCAIDVELVAEIRREANGKYRFAICHVPD